MSGYVLGSYVLNLDFSDAEGHDGNLISGNPCFMQLTEKVRIRVAVQSVDYDIGMNGFDTFYESGIICVSKRGIFLTHAFSTHGIKLSLYDLVGCMRENVIASYQEHAFLSVPQKIVYGRNYLLVGAGIDYILRFFHSLVLDRIPEERVLVFHNGDDCLSGGRGPAAENRGYIFGCKQHPGFFREDARVGKAVLFNYLYLLSKDTARGIDFLYSQFFRLQYRNLADGHGSAERVEEPNLNRIAAQGGYSPVTAGYK